MQAAKGRRPTSGRSCRRQPTGPANQYFFGNTPQWAMSNLTPVAEYSDATARRDGSLPFVVAMRVQGILPLTLALSPEYRGEGNSSKEAGGRRFKSQLLSPYSCLLSPCLCHFNPARIRSCRRRMPTTLFCVSTTGSTAICDERFSMRSSARMAMSSFCTRIGLAVISS